MEVRYISYTSQYHVGVVSKALTWVVKGEIAPIENRIRRPFPTKRSKPERITFPDPPRIRLEDPPGFPFMPESEIRDEITLVEMRAAKAVDAAVTTEQDIIFPDTVVIDHRDECCQAEIQSANERLDQSSSPLILDPGARSASDHDGTISESKLRAAIQVAHEASLHRTPSSSSSRSSFYDGSESDTARTQNANVLDSSATPTLSGFQSTVKKEVIPIPSSDPFKRSTTMTKSSSDRAFKLKLPRPGKHKRLKGHKRIELSRNRAATIIQVWWRHAIRERKKRLFRVVHQLFDEYFSESGRTTPQIKNTFVNSK
jgi:hypothetical protein